MHDCLQFIQLKTAVPVVSPCFTRKRMAPIEFSHIFPIIPLLPRRKMFREKTQVLWQSFATNLAKRSGFSLDLRSALEVSGFELHQSGGEWFFCDGNDWVIEKRKSYPLMDDRLIRWFQRWVFWPQVWRIHPVWRAYFSHRIETTN